MFCKAVYDHIAFKTFFQRLVQQQQRARHILAQHTVREPKVEIGIEQVQVLHGIAVGEHTICKAGYTVQHTQCITHRPLTFLGYHMQCGFLGYHAFFAGNALQVRHNIMRSDALKVKYLAAAQYGREYLVFLGSGKDEDGIGWWFFQCFQEGVKRRGT